MHSSDPKLASRSPADPTPRACFVALGAYPLFDPTAKGPMGGMESRAWIFARALARRGETEVSFVVDDCGQGPLRVFDGITVYARTNPLRTELSGLVRGVHRSRAGIRQISPAGLQRGYLSLAWRLPLCLTRSLRRVTRQVLSAGVTGGPALYARIPADVFLPFGVNGFSAEVIAACRRNHRRSILCLASDADLDEAFLTPSDRARSDGVRGIEGHFALTNADAILVQSRSQFQLLRERFGRTGHLLRNPIDLSGDDTEGRPLEPRVAATVAKGPCVLWVGRSDPVYKRPDLCFELARKVPQVRFVMVVAPTDANHHNELKRRRPANVDFIEGLPFRAMPHLFRQCLALVNTSSQEGFPNTFLQAGKYRVPIVSLIVDPDELFWSRRAGIVCNGNLDVMADAVADLASNPERRKQYADRLADYVALHHDLQGCCEELSDVIRRTIHGAEDGASAAWPRGSQTDHGAGQPTRAEAAVPIVPLSKAS